MHVCIYVARKQLSRFPNLTITVSIIYTGVSSDFDRFITGSDFSEEPNVRLYLYI